MALTRTLLIVLAGGAGSRLETLTEHRAKPALRFGGSHRLIDFPLSNAANSGVRDVWVLEQFEPESITQHLAGGRPWDLDRSRGGLMLLGPHRGDEREGWHAGTADALWRKADRIREHDPEVVVVASADAVYRMDYADVVARHVAGDAEVTMVTTRHDGDCSRYGVVRVEEGRVTDYLLKPDDPPTRIVTTEVFAFTPAALLTTLETYADEADEDGLGDLGEQVLPAMVGRGAAAEYRHTAYWQDVGTVEAYWSAHMELLEQPPFDLDDPAWPVRTPAQRHVGARVHARGQVEDSLLSPGVVVEGTVRRSVLAPGVQVAPGAQVVDSVLLDDVRVGPGATVRRSVVDEGARVRGRAEVGGDGEVTLVGAGSVVHPRKRIPAGGRYPG
ncbi:glucose-1-phosphate adenylyltransferase [Georgenia satyanarayanai]|uniref:Glucose-1-phosphate adenylyltransferase n=1 Tax=Georgenia satyanarayanai TaxID=860221 RepID=A0A2Y9ADZ7_9MICO|nr:sugar phosphate nucleotidyltransferase [Georgenia satyanarayanai]PYF99560.1 glucose-1-phosphate adenylyltransferase [Georgenia satyanarayanai]SSA42405.1 glucose-1-phosphate adenylyltransferase [Georgenia satyanarayanai]